MLHHDGQNRWTPSTGGSSEARSASLPFLSLFGGNENEVGLRISLNQEVMTYFDNSPFFAGVINKVSNTGRDVITPDC
jgi:hypothetical protein